MRARSDPSDALRRLAVEQDGVVTSAQAAKLGPSRHSRLRLLKQGQWQRLGRGVLLTHNQTPSWEAHARAGILRGGDGARLGGYAAAYLHRLIDQPPDTILVLVRQHIELSSQGPWMFWRERVGVRRSGTIGSPPRTLIDDNVLDLCDGRFGDDDRKPATHWVTTAVRSGRSTTTRLRKELAARSRISCRREMEELLIDVQDGVESPLELNFLRKVERPHGLPRGTRQA